MKICVLDDNETTTKYVNKMIIDSCINLNIPEPDIFCFLSPDEFVPWFNYENSIDICFLDIDLKSTVNGLSIAKMIKDVHYNTLLIFMTSYNNYLSDIVQVEPFRFLAKPFNYEDFYPLFLAAYKRILSINSERECIYRFKNNGITFGASLKDIIYISSYKRKIIMLSIKEGNIEFYGKLDEVEREIKLLTSDFIRINKSYLFNSRYIENIGKNSIVVQGITYQISPMYKHNLKIIT